MGCMPSKQNKHSPGYEDPKVLASETSFTVSDVQALHELFNKLSSSIIKDGLIHREEFQLALFRNSKRKNLFADRIFETFDVKRNGVIEFGEFVRSLSIFHPNAPVGDKIAFAFKLYDLRYTGFIEREELKEMVFSIIRQRNLHGNWRMKCEANTLNYLRRTAATREGTTTRGRTTRGGRGRNPAATFGGDRQAFVEVLPISKDGDILKYLDMDEGLHSALYTWESELFFF